MIFFYLCLSLFFISTPIGAHESSAELSTDRVFYRFYLLNRLKPSIELVLHVIEKEAEYSTGLVELICTLDVTETHQFSHPVVQNEIKQMCMNHDSQVLIKLIKTLKQYRYIRDDQYVKEVVMLLLVVHKNILTNIASRNYTHVNHAMSSYSLMQDMTLEELLETLDSASDALEQMYEYVSLPSILRPSYCIGLGLFVGAALWLAYR